MRRRFVLLALVAACATATPAAPAAASESGIAGSFVTRPGSEVIPGYQHVSGIGLSGAWQGWRLGMDYVVSTDCFTVCPIERMRWEIYSGDRRVWGTCLDDGYGICDGAGIRPISNEVTIPLTITGGTTWMDSGSGTIEGHIAMLPELNPAVGLVTVSLAPS